MTRCHTKVCLVRNSMKILFKTWIIITRVDDIYRILFLTLLKFHFEEEKKKKKRNWKNFNSIFCILFCNFFHLHMHVLKVIIKIVASDKRGFLCSGLVWKDYIPEMQAGSRQEAKRSRTTRGSDREGKICIVCMSG